jgi:hypothetical protein
MKRIVYEWGLIATVAMGIAAATVWGISRYATSTLFHLHTWPQPESSLHLLVRHGDLWLCDGVVNNRFGDAEPPIIGPPFATDYQRGDRLRRFHAPGFAFQYYWLAPWRNAIWSIKVSLLIPVFIFLSSAVLFYHCLKGLRRVTVVSPAKTHIHVLDRADVR